MEDLKFDVKKLKSGVQLSKDGFTFCFFSFSSKTLKFKLPYKEKLPDLYKLIENEFEAEVLIKGGKGVVKDSIDNLNKIIRSKKFVKFINENVKLDYMFDCEKEHFHFENKTFLLRKTGSIDNERSTLKYVLSGAYEKLGSKFNKQDVWGDIGCNIGGFSILYADRVKQIYSFDILDTNCNLVKQAAELNNYHNVTVVNKGVTGEKGKVKQRFYFGKSPGSNGFMKRSTKVYRDVELIEINDLIENYGVNCLKIDCEGMEYEILKNISNANYKKIKQIVFEFHLDLLNDVGVGEKYFEIINILKSKFTTVHYKDDIKNNWNLMVYCIK